MNDLITNPIDDGWHNCTTYSTKMWNAVAPKKYKLTGGFLGIDAPKLAAKKMKKINGYQSAVFTHKQSIDWTDVLYVLKKSELVPVIIKKPTIKSTKKTGNSVTLNWSSGKKSLLNKKTNVTEYLIHYYPVDTLGQYKSKTVTSNKATITGLQG